MSDAALVEILRFYCDSGVDCVLHDGLREEVGSVPIKDVAGVDSEENRKDKLIVDWVVCAREMAAACHSLAELEASVRAFDGCDIKKFAMNTVFADSNPCAKIMLIGEAPGSNEDREGRPFCGASGVLLDKMLKSINLDRKSVYISNVVFWRPPGNRKPTDFELEVCKPFVERHISLVVPELLVLVGNTACHALLGAQSGISRLRGKFYDYTNVFLGHTIAATVMFHPAYLLRQPVQKRLAWEDLKLISSYVEKKSLR